MIVNINFKRTNGEKIIKFAKKFDPIRYKDFVYNDFQRNQTAQPTDIR